MQRIALVAVPLVLLVGCYKDNLLSCDRPENAGHPPCGPDAMLGPPPCQSNTECMLKDPALPVCEMSLGGGTCVHCTPTDKALCTLALSRCENHTCVKCVVDGDCGDRGVCLTEGCVDPARIIHARVNGSTAKGCGAINSECNLPTAITEVTAQRNVIRLDDAPPAAYSADGFNLTSDLILDAGNAILRRSSSSGPILTLMGKTVRILGGRIQNASGPGILCGAIGGLTLEQTIIEMNSQSGIDADSCTVIALNAQIRDSGMHGIDMKNGGFLTVARSLIAANKRAGLRIDNSRFVAVGNAIFNNGDPTLNAVASVAITTVFDAGNRFEFNTVASNMAQPGVPAISCFAGVSPAPENKPFVGRNNIVWSNSGSRQVDGNCQYAFSDIDQDVVQSGHDAGSNLRNNPNLVSGTYPHLVQGSPAIGKADPDANLIGLAQQDIDGDVRVKPADQGADQFVAR